jgi:predicted trehalose synthase
MRIGGSYPEIFQNEEITSRQLDKATSETGKHRDSPSSWGSDSVAISSAARDAQQTSGSDGKTEEDNKAFETFKEYMDKKRGVVGSSGSSIEDLRAKLKELHSKLASVADNPSMEEQTKAGMIDAIKSEIAQVVEQIAELEAQSFRGRG